MTNKNPILSIDTEQPDSAAERMDIALNLLQLADQLAEDQTNLLITGTVSNVRHLVQALHAKNQGGQLFESLEIYLQAITMADAVKIADLNAFVSDCIIAMALRICIDTPDGRYDFAGRAGLPYHLTGARGFIDELQTFLDETLRSKDDNDPVLFDDLLDFYQRYHQGNMLRTTPFILMFPLIALMYHDHYKQCSPVIGGAVTPMSRSVKIIISAMHALHCLLAELNVRNIRRIARN